MKNNERLDTDKQKDCIHSAGDCSIKRL